MEQNPEGVNGWARAWLDFHSHTHTHECVEKRTILTNTYFTYKYEINGWRTRNAIQNTTQHFLQFGGARDAVRCTRTRSTMYGCVCVCVFRVSVFLDELRATQRNGYGGGRLVLGVLVLRLRTPKHSH